ncbi:hypothetical protein ACIF6L_12500 [Kitasatospora sp. NPDC086009]|uniref:hypothetical protein n=1 Tax=unclassified Kitasatospora TaxID=2633591 RepID=UPI0037C625A4
MPKPRRAAPAPTTARRNWDLLTTGSVLAAVPVVIGFVLLQRLFVRGLTGGAVKE